MRLLPNAIQTQLLWNHIHASRFVWNYALALQEEAYKSKEKFISKYDMRQKFREIKQLENFKWLKDISSHTISNVCIDLDKSYALFFKNLTGKPKFKKKNKCKSAFPVRQDRIYFFNNLVNIEKIGKIRYVSNLNIPQGRNSCKFSNPRICYENNKWILSFCIECENQAPILNNYSLGIDLGVKELATVFYNNNHKIYKNINKSKRVKMLKHKLIHLQRKLDRKYKTNNVLNIYDKKYYKSNNIIKVENQIRQVYNQLFNIRTNYIHQITHEIVSLFPRRIVMENLNITGMMKNKHLSKAIGEQCFYSFIQKMKYKCEWNGIEFVQADRFYPSSKSCSGCGCIKSDLKLSDRTYVCKECGLVIDRDLNAAINLSNYSKA